MSYATGSAQDRLNAVRQAIQDCLSAQQYSIGNRSKQMAQLATLNEMEKRLIQEVNEGSVNGGSMASLGQIGDVTW